MNDLRTIRLASHGLLSSAAQSPKEIVAYMGAIQAQDYNAAKWAVGARLQGCTDAMVEEAFNKGEILRTHIMRPTWHFVTPEDIRWMLPLTAKRITASTVSRDRQLGITEEMYLKANNIIAKALSGGNRLTRNELAGIVKRAGVTAETPHMVHFMMRAEQDAVVCSGALRNKEQT